MLDNFIFEDIQEMKEKELNFRAVMYEKTKNPKGETLFERIAGNTSMIGGTQKLAQLMLDLTNTDPALNPISTFDGELTGMLTPTGTTDISSIFGVMFGLGGGYQETIDVIHRNEKGFTIGDIIPMRKVLATNESEATLRTSYELRRVNDPYVEYYVKKPASITFQNKTITGTPIENNPHDYNGGEDVVSVITINVKITQNDMSEYFSIDEGDINLRRFSNVTICYGDKVLFDVSGTEFVDRRNVIVTNKFNTLTRPLGAYGEGDYYFVIYFK